MVLRRRAKSSGADLCPDTATKNLFWPQTVKPFGSNLGFSFGSQKLYPKWDPERDPTGPKTGPKIGAKNEFINRKKHEKLEDGGMPPAPRCPDPAFRIPTFRHLPPVSM
jgi:hypothetical protein